VPSDQSREENSVEPTTLSSVFMPVTLNADHTISISAILPDGILPYTPSSGNRSSVNFKAVFCTLQL
jgi:hypothetical protein